jgi:transcriptional regulator of aromatic amino acid metabolism
MSSNNSTSLDIISSLTATAPAPVLIEACTGRDDMARRCHVRPTLLMLSMALGTASLDAQAAETFRQLTGEQIAGVLAGMRRDAEDRHPIVGIMEKPTDPPTTAMKR